MKRICLHPWFSASLRQEAGGGDKNIEKEALCSKCIVFILHENTTTGGPASFMQQVMHYIFTWSWRIQIQNVVAKTNTNTNTCQFHATGDALHIHLPGAGEARQIQNAKLDKYKMQI